MCINFETSLVSFGIGLFSGIALIQQPGVKRSIGYFTLFFSLVQLCEAIIYSSKSSRNLISRLLFLTLGFQGLVFALAFSRTLRVNPLLLSFFTAVAVITLWYATTQFDEYQNVKVSENGCCLSWEFLNDHFIVVLWTIMYAGMFMWVFLQKNKCCRRWGAMLFATMLLSYVIQPIQNRPSFWCISSAVVSPLTLWLC